MAGGSNERQKARPGASLEAMIPRGRYLTWKLRALCWSCGGCARGAFCVVSQNLAVSQFEI
jgi:hypothetical protein